MKKDNIIKIVISIVIMLLLGYLAIFGLKIGDKTIIKGAKSIKTGLDINGGVTVLYQAEAEEGKEIRLVLSINDETMIHEQTSFGSHSRNLFIPKRTPLAEIMIFKL